MKKIMNPMKKKPMMIYMMNNKKRKRNTALQIHQL